ncbi:prosaposin [Neocloeon triangulifer]|uniref:prosaposin n=1 Tax=Neocloeon triangulifer TaxID=2078957 RepID=UPI00286ED00C|nr:prosaposin [Neocloeon triangulifer]
MNTWACLLLAVCFAGALANPISKDESKGQKFPKECGIGPTYWCHNITTAHNCRAVKHCIQTVWEHQKLEADNDDICTICKDMVTQARDQLESNETQEELKEVFEGSCKLIPIKIINQECMKVFDDFIPDLVDALASQMNPQMVCTTAGLCNNARIDRLLAENSLNQVYTKYGQQCGDCHAFVDDVQPKLESVTDKDIVERLMQLCGKMGSLSLGCREIVLSHADDITGHIRKHFNAREVCDLSGSCKAKHHEHAQPLLATAHRNEKDETCDLCEHLVQHLRDVLVSNTTEEEFKDVLVGICKQTKTSFKQQCLSLVSEYYPMIYHFLSAELQPRMVCDLAGICHEDVKRRPLLGMHEGDLYRQRHKMHLIGGDETKVPELARVPLTKKESNVQVINSDILVPLPPALPIELMMPQSVIGGNKVECETCQYFLHYVQQELTLPSTEAEIKEFVDEACDHLPKSIGPQCRSFVSTYADALIALLAQEVDPSQVCPSLGLCPTFKIPEVLPSTDNKKDNPTCPLCLYAMQQLDKMLKDNRTEDSVKEALESVCAILPKKMVAECDTFVDKYSEELIDMVIAEYTPEEVCTNLKMCGPKEFESEMMTGNDEKQAHIETNEIVLPKDDELVKAVSNAKDDNRCVICEFVMTQLDDMLKNNATEDDIKNAVHTVCNYLPKSVSTKCNEFVNEYADLVIQLLVQSLDPKQVCQELGLCNQAVKTAEEKCTLCLVVVEAMDKLLEDGSVEKDVATILDKVCSVVPKSKKQQCRNVIDEYGPSIMLLVAQLADKNDVCAQVKICPVPSGNRSHLLGAKKCTFGPSYWCQSEFHAMACKATKHCQEKVWKAAKP